MTKKSSTGNRESILAAAIPLFASNGTSGVSVRDIAAAASVNIPTIYHYFGDKDGLYQESCSVIFTEANEKLRQSIRQGVSSEANAISFLAELYAMLSSETSLSKLFLRKLADGDEAGLAKLTEESFFTAFDALNSVLSDFLTKPPERLQIISVFAFTFGLAQLSHLRPALRQQGEMMLDTPLEAAKFVMAMILPALSKRP